VLDIRFTQTRQALHRERQRAPRLHQALEHRDARLPRIQQQAADFQDLRARIRGEPGGLEVDDRERPDPSQEGRERARIDAQLFGRNLAPRECLALVAQT
jgi:hypothetical protein